MAELFNVVFAGEVVKGADLPAVRANVARVFNANEAMLDRLFSGQRVIVKKAVDQATAMKYRATLKQAGVNVSLEACDDQGRPLAAAPVQAAGNASATTSATTAAPALRPAAASTVAPGAAPNTAPSAAPSAAPARPMTMAERIARLAAEHEREAALRPRPNQPPRPADTGRVETWCLFPVGSDLNESRLEPVAPSQLFQKIAAFSIARPGGELLAAAERASLAPPPVQVPDLSRIRMAPAGSDILQPSEREVMEAFDIDLSALEMSPPNTEVLAGHAREVIAPVVVDIDHLSVAPVGSSLDQIREEKAAVNPDISRLKLA